LKIFRLAVRAIVLLTTGPALLAFTACTVSSVAILLSISGQATPGPAAAAPADQLGNGTVCYAWITGVRKGRPGGVTLEMARHYTGEAAERYAAEHRLPLPAGDQIDVDRRFAVTVTVAPRARILINADGRGLRRLPASAFLARAARNLAIKINGQFAGPLYEVGFDHGALVLAYQVFRP